VTRADNIKHETRYDVRGRPTTIINPDGTTYQNGFDGMFLRTMTSEDGRTTSLTYDNHSQISSVTDPGGRVTQYVRDEVGNVTTVRDPNGHETKYEYNTADRLVKKILPDGSFEQYTYDPDGHVITIRLTDGHINRYTWDGRDRLQRIDFFDGGVTAFTYTATGKRDTATGPNGVTHYAYDALDRLTTITQPNGVVVGYGYDAANNITSITTPRGVTRYTYDALDRMKTVTDPTGGVTTYTYDLGGRLTQRQLPNGVITDYGYDSNDRLTSMAHHLGAAAAFESFQYTLSPNGQRLSVREVDGSRRDWTYDNAYRLIKEAVANPAGTTVSELSYAYDQAGNRTSMTGNGLNVIYQYNQLDQMTSAGSAQYTYDGRGNLVRAADGSAVTTYSYDAANRLTAAAMPDGSSATYTYDADGRLTREVAGGTQRNYAWDELSQFGDIVYESDGGGSSVAGYSYGANELIQRLGTTPAYALQDGLGSIIGLTNAAGLETDRYRYDAWGARTVLAGSSSNSFGYRGQWHETTTSLLYLRSRWFGPTFGRFLTRDVAPFELNDPVDLNRYTYAAANPINFYDPTGHSATIEYGVISRQSTENATIEGYFVGRLSESLLSCAMEVLMASFVDVMIRGMVDAAIPNPISGKYIWKRLPFLITVAFGWALKTPIDAIYGPDFVIDLSTEAGRERMMAKAGAFRASPRELSWAMSGRYVNSLFKLLGDLAQFIAGIQGVFIGNEENLGDKCSNHAERKVVRYADPPGKSALLSVGASRPVCQNCRPVLIEKVLRYGGCFGPIGGNNQCRP
jgi:RHS repeat-associated protein